uniref:Peptide deformylase n=1 Tax=Chromera velia CCMP2878 TaxID=1169474 RepID=A0A0G4HR69_9ALVE|eukprot:Cvel_8043.t1-p1 / transcript=Cvel_8043.t1 / gene=Cvel_8043 / organism=Chromera_velia_CCMP2878 / gene_product=Peptide deformylase 2, putative / transcript_product=Peptide deformylase 2, putative / location=Cvel_scaffold435:34940-35605(-) / protein_length=222 / sequence_SO=supercontig / SO=protein_coding / is_pseudo=false
MLYTRCARVHHGAFGSLRLKELVTRMTDVMHSTGGIGIAANQCHTPLQVFIIEFAASSPRYADMGFENVPLEVFINPRIVTASAECRSFWHGCLSCQDEKRGELVTYEKISVEYRTVDGLLRENELSGIAAVIFQHEMRHLLGGTYLDRANPDRLLSLEELVEALESGRETRSRVLPSCDESSTMSTLPPHLIGDYRIGESLEEFYDRTGVPESMDKWEWTS